MVPASLSERSWLEQFEHTTSDAPIERGFAFSEGAAKNCQDVVLRRNVVEFRFNV